MIKELSEQELRHEAVVRVILKNCFEGLDDINSCWKETVGHADCGDNGTYCGSVFVEYILIVF